METDKKDTTNGPALSNDRENGKRAKNDRHKWVASLEHLLEYIFKNEHSEQADRKSVV